jgi:phage portal protein BeeE
MKSRILDRNGNPAIIKSTTQPNLDPGFWNIDSDSEYSIPNVMNRPFELYPWVYSCVDVIARNVAHIEKYLQKTADEEMVNDHPSINLLYRPNQMMDIVSFIYVVICNLLLPSKKNDYASGGQCFIVPWNAIGDKPARTGDGEIPDQLIPFSDAFFEPLYNVKNVRGMKALRGWTFNIPGVSDSKMDFEADEIIRIFSVNPYDVLKGMTPFSSIATSVETDLKADLFNRNIFDNNGKLDGQVTTDQIIDQSDLDKIKDKWYQQYAGPKQKRVAFLYGGLKYEQFGLSTTDLQYLDQSKWIRQKILAAYGLNRIAVGDYEEINFATIREGRKLLWYDKYMPIDNLLLSALNNQWIKNIDGGKYKLFSNYNKIQALQADISDRVKTGGIMVQQLAFPPALAARLNGIALTEDDLVAWPHLLEPVSRPTSAPAPGFSQQQLSIKSIGIDRNEYSRQYIKAVLDPVETKFRTALESYFARQRNKIMDEIDRKMNPEKTVSLKKDMPSISAWEFIPDETKETLELLSLHKKASKLQAAYEKRQVESELHRGIDWDGGGTRIDYWTNIRSGDLKKINTRTFIVAREAISATLKQGIEDGVDVGEMRKRIKDAVHDVYNIRIGKPVEPNGLFDLGGMSSSKTIARTEMGNIASMTRIDIFKQEKIKRIEWITAHDERVRQTHSECEKAGPVNVGDVFPNGLRFPRDPNGDAAEIINCRCSFVANTED